MFPGLVEEKVTIYDGSQHFKTLPLETLSEAITEIVIWNAEYGGRYLKENRSYFLLGIKYLAREENGEKKSKCPEGVEIANITRKTQHGH